MTDAVFAASPVTMAIETPRCRKSAMHALESERGGSLSATNPTSVIGAFLPKATPSTRKPLDSSSPAFSVASGEGCDSAITTEKAPLAIRISSPVPSVAVASAIFVAGSNGMKPVRVNEFFGDAVAAIRIAASTGSCPASELASFASASTELSS